MSVELLKETIKRELPGLLRDDPALRAYILDLPRQEYAGRTETRDRFYKQRHQRSANRLIVISPMIDARARKVAERLGIETYGDSTEVEML